MATVYRGFQPSLRREVAIKVLSAALAQQPGYMERFNREAEMAAALEHPNIVPIYDYGVQGGIGYVVMRLLNGGTLAERVQPPRLCGWAGAIAGRDCRSAQTACQRARLCPQTGRDPPRYQTQQHHV